MKKQFYLLTLTLLLSVSSAFAQLSGSQVYDLRDGTIIGNKQSDDGLLRLDGSFAHHGTQYGLNMKVDGKIDIDVTGSRTVRFLGSQHSSLNMTGTSLTGDDLGTLSTKVTNDVVDTYDFVYGGGANTLNFVTVAGTGNDLYLPSIELIPAQLGADEALTAAAKNIIYYFDLRDGSIIPTDTDGKSGIEKGLFKLEVGNSNAYGYNGTQHGSILKTGNQITLKVAGNSYIKLGGSIHSKGTITASSATGKFDADVKNAATAANFDADGSSVDFLYVGTEGTVTLTFENTNYIPYIELVPITKEVQLEAWVAKTGTISINGTVITLTAGATSSDAATVAVSDGTVVSATKDAGSVRINLGGAALDTFTPEVSGEVASATVNGNVLSIAFTDDTTKPNVYEITVADNSAEAQVEAGKTYTYDFADGSVLPQTGYSTLRYPVFISADNILTMESNTTDFAMQLGYHDASHGAVLFPGNSISMAVAGKAIISFVVCTHGVSTDAVFEITDSEGALLSTVSAQNIGISDGASINYTYKGGAGVIKATLKSESKPAGEVYIHGLSISNSVAIPPSSGKVDVWDFAATQLDEATYMNWLNVEAINAWYDASITPGSNGNVLPNFSAGVLSWVGGTNDRLRTTNEALTRYDENKGSSEDYAARIYVNSAAKSSRYMELTLSENDEVTVVVSADAGGLLNFVYVEDPEMQTNTAEIASEVVTLNFVAQYAGVYRIYDTLGKPSYYRIMRKDPTYKNLAGNIDKTAADGIPNNYALVFTNEAGKAFLANMSVAGYDVDLPEGYTYAISLVNASGYVIKTGRSVSVTSSTTSFDIELEKVALYTLSGSVVGLGDKIGGAKITFTPAPEANKSYEPKVIIDAAAGTYTVQLEAATAYTVSATGVNDYQIVGNVVTIEATATNADITFEMKPTYAVTIDASGLSAEQLAKLALTFTNLNETGYVYSFASVNDIKLRDGVYRISYSGLAEYAVKMKPTSYAKINGADVTKSLVFNAITVWGFGDENVSGSTFQGLEFTGTVSSEVAKAHLTAKAEATIRIPVNVGDKLKIGYYYSADFSIDGGEAITTSSSSTSTFESVEYTYTGTEAGFVTITVGANAATTYITEIAIGGSVEYKPEITVGTDKEFQSINAALAYIKKMARTAEERVTVLIDPADYEEMLVIDIPNITLKNASATPDIELTNKGAGISANAVRVTSYYGHGYSYYSMGNDQKWNADILAVNKENQELSYVNKGSGTTNGSYWNATVVVKAAGFEADHIIFENSFNQYISKKESEDVVVMWASGNKGERPTDAGNTAVQERSFVERAAAISLVGADKAVLNKCRVVGRQDSFYGDAGSRVVVYKGAMMGAVDYIFGAMVAVFYESDLVMNTSDNSSDVSYLTAAQHKGGRGYLMYECHVRSAVLGTETASTMTSKPGYFGRPWEATSSEVVFYNTKVDKSEYTDFEGMSLINPAGWMSTLGGESAFMYEYGTVEASGEDNLSQRASWSTLLDAPTLTDGTEITTLNFTKGTDEWDPIPALIDADIPPVEEPTGIEKFSNVNIYAHANRIFIQNVQAKTQVDIFNLNGTLLRTVETLSDTSFSFKPGMWIVRTTSVDGYKVQKILIQ